MSKAIYYDVFNCESMTNAVWTRKKLEDHFGNGAELQEALDGYHPCYVITERDDAMGCYSIQVNGGLG